MADRYIRTHPSHDLRLQSELVRESCGKVYDIAIPITGHVRNLSDMVEHVAASKEQDDEETDGCPKVSVLNHREDIGSCDAEECYQTQYSCCDDYDPYVIGGALDWWLIGPSG